MQKKHHNSSYKKTEKSEPRFMVTEYSELMSFLIANMPHKNRNNIKTLLREKQVYVDNQAVSQFNFELIPGQEVVISPTKISEEKSFRGISILYEDDYLIVVDKHAGVLSIAAPNKSGDTAYSMLSFHVKQQDASNKIFVVHRLDRETSGLLIYAKSQDIQEKLQETWHNTVLERSYLAVVEGIVEKQEDTISSYLTESKALIVYSSQNPELGKKAITHYKLLKVGKGFSLLKISLETGRKNQIRVHMKDIGHSVVGDKKYGSLTNPIGRLGLHAWILSFKHPVTGETMRFETPIPRKFTRLF